MALAMPHPLSGGPVDDRWTSIAPQRLPLALAEVDLDGALIRANPAFGDLTGVAASHVIGQPYWNLLHVEDRTDEAEAFRRLREAEPARASAAERRLVRPDGSTRWVELRRALVADAGAPHSAALVLIDVTDRTRTTAALLRSEQRFRDTFAQAAVGMAEVSIHGQFLQVNESLCELLGYSRDRLQGMRFQDITWPEDLESTLEHAQRLLNGELSTYVLEKRYLRGDGTPVWAALSVSLVRTAAGDPLYFIAVVQDITDRKRAEAEARAARAQAEDANRLKDEFIATLSHELRTPLNAMLGWTNLLKSGMLPADQQARAIETIERNARAQARLLGDILDVSRIVAGKITLDRRPTSLAAVVERVIEDVRVTILDKRLEVELGPPPADTTVLGEPSRLQQVVWNLLSNAVKFTPAGGRIDVSLASQAGSVTLTVRDSGIGIAPEFLPFVFDRFRQADASNTRRQAGLGLGLAIARHLVQLHGGTVAAQSEGPGRGATFSVVLPLLTRTGEDAELETSESPAMNISGTRVLVVDDHDDARDLARVVLEQHGAVVDTAASTAEAVTRFRQHGCDLALLDISMPIEDGFACLERLRTLAAADGRPLRAVALTSHAGSAFTERAFAAGFAAVVGKPIAPGQLVAVVWEHARRSDP